MARNFLLQIVYILSCPLFFQRRRLPALKKRKQLQLAMKVMDVEKGQYYFHFCFLICIVC